LWFVPRSLARFEPHSGAWDRDARSGIGSAGSRSRRATRQLGFLDITGAWDASLLFVLGAAVPVALAGFRLAQRRPAPLFDEHFRVPAAQRVDVSLIAGSAIFGIGWGLAGYCPGPAIAALGFGSTEALWFVPALLVGAGPQRWQARRGGANAPFIAVA
jgi:hypothetical protein